MNGTFVRPTEARIERMESKLAREAKQDLIAATQRLSAEERLNAFLAHSRLIVALYQAGKRIRSASRQTGSRCVGKICC